MNDPVMRVINFCCNSPYVGAVVFLIGLACMGIGSLIGLLIEYISNGRK